MCRLFAMSGGEKTIGATFWLLDAKVSLVRQSVANADGTGLAWFDEDGLGYVDKLPIAGHVDAAFAADARRVRARTILAHVRYATSTPRTIDNTHPFLQDGRMFGHNGVVGDRCVGVSIPGPQHAVHAQAPVDGSLAARASVRVDEQADAWARRRGARHGNQSAVIFASERLNDDAWEPVHPGELVHVSPDLGVTREEIIDFEPLRPMVLGGQAAAAQGLVTTRAPRRS